MSLWGGETSKYGERNSKILLLIQSLFFHERVFICPSFMQHSEGVDD